MNTITLENGHTWTNHESGNPKIQRYAGNWGAPDGDLVELYIETDESGFEIAGIFSGITGASSMWIDELDVPTIIRNVMKQKYDNSTSFAERCCMVADFVCSKFMEYHTPKEQQ